MFISPLHIGGESYVTLPNGIVHTRQWREKIIGKEITDTIFEFCEKLNQLSITDCEKSLLIPLVITRFGNYIKRINYLKII